MTKQIIATPQTLARSRNVVDRHYVMICGPGEDGQRGLEKNGECFAKVLHCDVFFRLLQLQDPIDCFMKNTKSLDQNMRIACTYGRSRRDCLRARRSHLQGREGQGTQRRAGSLLECHWCSLPRYCFMWGCRMGLQTKHICYLPYMLHLSELRKDTGSKRAPLKPSDLAQARARAKAPKVRTAGRLQGRFGGCDDRSTLG